MIWCMVGLLAVSLIIVGAIVVWRPHRLSAVQDPDEILAENLNVWVIPPKNMSNLPMSDMNWDEAECSIEIGEKSFPVVLLPEHAGFKIHLGSAAKKCIRRNEYVKLTLKDKKNNKWSVGPFVMLDKQVPLQMLENREKIIAD